MIIEKKDGLIVLKPATQWERKTAMANGFKARVKYPDCLVAEDTELNQYVAKTISQGGI